MSFGNNHTDFQQDIPRKGFLKERILATNLRMRLERASEERHGESVLGTIKIQKKDGQILTSRKPFETILEAVSMGFK